MKTPFQYLTEEQKKKIHEARIKKNYKYRKAICKAFKMYMSLDETFYYNKYMEE